MNNPNLPPSPLCSGFTKVALTVRMAGKLVVRMLRHVTAAAAGCSRSHSHDMCKINPL